MTLDRVKAVWHDDRRLRRLLLVVDAGLIYFWVYSVVYVFEHPAEKGSDGFEVFLAVPMTLIALCLSFPAQLLVVWNRTLRISAWISAAAIVANTVIGGDVLWNSGLGRGPFWPIW